MPFNPANPLAGLSIGGLQPIPDSQMTGRDPNDWARALAILGATLKDVGGAVGGVQSNALPILQARQDQQRLQNQRELAQASLGTTFMDAQRSGQPLDPRAMAPVLAQAAAAGVDISPYQQLIGPPITAFQQAQLAADKAREAESGRRFDWQQVADSERDVAGALERSNDRSRQMNERARDFTQRAEQNSPEAIRARSAAEAEGTLPSQLQLQAARIQADAANSGLRSQQGEGIWRLANGRTVAPEFVPGRGIGYRDTNNNWQPMPADAKRTSVGAGGYLQPQQYMKLKNDFTQEQQALQRLNRYGASLGDMNVGIRRWGDAVSANVKTAIGGGKLSPQEFAQMTAQGQLQALLGLFRTDVVGPGVMTEYDAQRVIAALGGDVGSLQNPEVASKLLGDIYADKMERVRLMKEEIDRNREVFGDSELSIRAPDSFMGKPNAPTLPSGTPVKITGEDDYTKLPKGASYIDPKGVLRVKR